MTLLSSPKGFALMTVMWVIVILSAIALSFAVMTKAETHSTMAFKESVEGKLLAEAGVQRAILEILYRRAQLGPPGNQDVVIQDEGFLHVDGTRYTGRLGEASYAYRVTDETGKISINALTDSTGIVLNNLLRRLGDSEGQANTIVDSVLDWKDGDDLHRASGAEDDYYMSLPNPYHARNANFETLEELLLVKGMTRETLFGSDACPGLIDFITLYTGESETININAAPREVLLAIPEMTEASAEAIIVQRAEGGLKSEQDLQAILGDTYKEVSRYASLTGTGSTFTIEAWGLKGQEMRGYGVRATVVVEDGSRFRYVYYKSPWGRRE